VRREHKRHVDGGNPCETGSYRGFAEEAREGTRRAYAQRENNQSVLGIVARLDRVVPVIEHLKKRTHQADRQNKDRNRAGKLGSHRAEYISLVRILFYLQYAITRFSCVAWFEAPDDPAGINRTERIPAVLFAVCLARVALFLATDFAVWKITPFITMVLTLAIAGTLNAAMLAYAELQEASSKFLGAEWASLFHIDTHKNVIRLPRPSSDNPLEKDTPAKRPSR